MLSSMSNMKPFIVNVQDCACRAAFIEKAGTACERVPCCGHEPWRCYGQHYVHGSSEFIKCLAWPLTLHVMVDHSYMTALRNSSS